MKLSQILILAVISAMIGAEFALAARPHHRTFTASEVQKMSRTGFFGAEESAFETVALVEERRVLGETSKCTKNQLSRTLERTLKSLRYLRKRINRLRRLFYDTVRPCRLNLKSAYGKFPFIFLAVQNRSFALAEAKLNQVGANIQTCRSALAGVDQTDKMIVYTKKVTDAYGLSKYLLNSTAICYESLYPSPPSSSAPPSLESFPPPDLRASSPPDPAPSSLPALSPHKAPSHRD